MNQLTDRDHEGFSLLEVMVAMTILAMLLVGVIPTFTALVQRNTAMEVRTGAIGAAQLVLDRLRLADPASLPTSGTDPEEEVLVDNREFLVTVSYCVESSFCASSNNRHITVRVVYQGEELFDVQTVYTRLR